MPRSWRAAWARPVWLAPVRSRSTSNAASCLPAISRRRRETSSPSTARPARSSSESSRRSLPRSCRCSSTARSPRRSRPCSAPSSASSSAPTDARVARLFGAEGIGLCRTEHMFFGENRIVAVRQMIVADSEEDRRKALARLLPMQREDFVGIFREMGERPVTIRLLDPPLHEFLPHEDAAVKKTAEELGISPEKLRDRVRALAEANPMLGHRGCRLGITFPEIYEMQVRAIFEA